MQGESVEVTQDLTYELRSKGLFTGITDMLFVRRQFTASLTRSLDGLKREAEASERAQE